jgi:hypothetical protein
MLLVTRRYVPPAQHRSGWCECTVPVVDKRLEATGPWGGQRSKTSLAGRVTPDRSSSSPSERTALTHAGRAGANAGMTRAECFEGDVKVRLRQSPAAELPAGFDGRIDDVVTAINNASADTNLIQRLTRFWSRMARSIPSAFLDTEFLAIRADLSSPH